MPFDEFGERAQARAVLACNFATLKAFVDNAFSPTMQTMATRAAGNCLWALGLEEYGGIKAVPLEKVGATIDLTQPLQIEERKSDD